MGRRRRIEMNRKKGREEETMGSNRKKIEIGRRENRKK